MDNLTEEEYYNRLSTSQQISYNLQKDKEFTAKEEFIKELFNDQCECKYCNEHYPRGAYHICD